eukprot:tig00000093_g3645.t1
MPGAQTGKCYSSDDCTGQVIPAGNQSEADCFEHPSGGSYKTSGSNGTCTAKPADAQLDEELQVELDLAEADAELSMLDVEAEFAADLADA